MQIRTLARRFAPIARRDAVIARQRCELAKLKQAVSESNDRVQALTRRQQELTNRPSFFLKLRATRRIFFLLEKRETPDLVARMRDKDAGYAFAACHGIASPVILGRHPDAGSLDWSALPDEFVLKTVSGSGAQGVVPLVRHDVGTYRDLLGCDGVVTPADVTALLAEKVQSRGVSEELLVEEMLHSPYPDWPGLPLDVKVYCFYGEVGMLMVRASGGSRRNDQIKVRYFDPSGTDLGAVMSHRDIDPALPAPIHLSSLVDAGQRMSAALRTPFVRLDFYEQPDRIVFGEVTPIPGGKQLARTDIDQRLGVMWEHAEARLRADLSAQPAFRPELDAEPRP